MGDVLKFPSTDTTFLGEQYEDDELLSTAASNQTSFNFYENKMEAYSTLTESIKEEGDSMDWKEKYIDELGKKMRDISIDNKELRSEINSVQTNMERSFDNRFNQFMAELRDRDNQRHAEILAIQKQADNRLEQLKTEISGVKTEMGTTRKWIIGLLATFFGIALSVMIYMGNMVGTLATLAKAALHL